VTLKKTQKKTLEDLLIRGWQMFSQNACEQGWNPTKVEKIQYVIASKLPFTVE
jgi:hypothetical protein